MFLQCSQCYYLTAKSPGKFFKELLCFYHLFGRTVALLVCGQEMDYKNIAQFSELNLLVAEIQLFSEVLNFDV